MVYKHGRKLVGDRTAKSSLNEIKSQNVHNLHTYVRMYVHMYKLGFTTYLYSTYYCLLQLHAQCNV